MRRFNKNIFEITFIILLTTITFLLICYGLNNPNADSNVYATPDNGNGELIYEDDV